MSNRCSRTPADSTRGVRRPAGRGGRLRGGRYWRGVFGSVAAPSLPSEPELPNACSTVSAVCDGAVLGRNTAVAGGVNASSSLSTAPSDIALSTSSSARSGSTSVEPVAITSISSTFGDANDSSRPGVARMVGSSSPPSTAGAADCSSCSLQSGTKAGGRAAGAGIGTSITRASSREAAGAKVIRSQDARSRACSGSRTRRTDLSRSLRTSSVRPIPAATSARKRDVFTAGGATLMTCRRKESVTPVELGRRLHAPRRLFDANLVQPILRRPLHRSRRSMIVEMT